jgi:hypothetical protein
MKKKIKESSCKEIASCILNDIKFHNSEGCSLNGQTLHLLPRDHQFESHKSQGH